ncbi:MAG: LuxR family transcriptional regulator [Neomegalonema sp.]|nr:LuxR family transcriptional regulator [Neomegalonema sp.]
MSDAIELMQQFSRIKSVEELKNVYSFVLAELGVDYYLLANRFDLREPPEGAVLVGNCPQFWIEFYIERMYHLDDPIHQASQKVSRIFLWEELPQLLTLTRHQVEMVREIYQSVIGSACTLPIHSPDAPSGICTFAVKKGREFPTRALPILSFVGALGFECARRIAKADATGKAKDTPELDAEAKLKLTGRQLEVLRLLGQGKTDWEIATILGISASTVRKHVEAAKRHYDVASRTQLVVRALIKTDLSFRDLIVN